MIEHLVQTISLNFSVVEDRLELRCKSGHQSYQLWMTQRMWLQLTPAVIKWLVASGVGSPSTKAFIKESFAENKAVPVELVAGGLGEAHADADAHQATNPQEVDNDSGLTSVWAPVPWLCTTANLQMSDKAIRISFVSDRSKHSFLFSMSALEACHFLIAQRNALKKSHWIFDWPSWLSESSELEISSDQASVH